VGVERYVRQRVGKQDRDEIGYAQIHQEVLGRLQRLAILPEGEQQPAVEQQR
jgi:hypothetical protein